MRKFLKCRPVLPACWWVRRYAKKRSKTLDVQLAARYENFSDVGETTVGKLAFGWRPLDQLLVRGSYSSAFRAPNLVTINEQFIARSNTRNDWVVFYAVNEGGVPENNSFSGDGRYSMQRFATGSKDLEAEESINTSFGIVVDPIDNLTFTLDFWTIEKEDTIGLFGEENHVLLDLVMRLAAGTSDCANVQGNPAVTRGDPNDDYDAEFLALGLCPIGQVDYVSDTYTNLDTRTIEGYDVGIYYDIETGIGRFGLKYNGSFYEKYNQEASSGPTVTLEEAKAANPGIDEFPIIGIGDLLKFEGNQEERHTATLSWRKSDLGASVTMFRIGDFYQELSNGDRFPVPSMTTYNMTLDYSFDVADTDTRLRFGMRNFTDERAPLYDSSFGYSSDAHRDYGRTYYLDLRMRF